MKFLNSLVGIASRFQRSVNISHELSGEIEAGLEGYQLLASCVQLLDNFALHLEETKQRAFTITGAYGCGKSSLGLFLCNLAGTDRVRKEAAKKKLLAERGNERILRVFGEPKRRVLVMNGRKGSLSDDLNRAFFPDITGGYFIDNLKNNPHLLQEPVLLMIDELGRYVSGSQMENCALLQDLAELINASDARFVFLGILHQNFTAYEEARSLKDEWAKVQGRFVDLPLVSHQEETLKILSGAVVQSSVPKESREVVEHSISKVLEYFKEKRSISTQAYRKSFLESWPINPVVALLLGPISRRGFWQNNRSIFSFLTSKEPFAFQDYLVKTPDTSTELYCPYHFWDYLNDNYSHLIISDRSESRKWLNAQECIERAGLIGTEDHVRLTKTIALISIFKAGSGTDTHRLILEAALPLFSEEMIAKLLDDLIEKKVISARKAQESYVLFDAGSYDVEKEKERYKDFTIESVNLEEFVKLPPVIARKHYAKTGNIRLFRFKLTAYERVKEEIGAFQNKAPGEVYLILDTFDCDKQRDLCIERLKRSLQKAHFPPVLFGFPENSKRLSDIAAEITVLKKIEKDPLLEGDRVAKLEVESRSEVLIAQLREEVNRLYRNVYWLFPDGSLKETSDFKALDSLLSDFCDSLYLITPYFNNELINRQKVSPAGKGAQRKLITAMVASESQKRLGLEGTPPEAAAYMTFFEKNALHVSDENGVFRFVLPQGDGENARRIRAVWEQTEKILSKKKLIDLTELYAIWDLPPFGIKSGLKPLLLVYFFLVFKDSLSFYQNELYEPFLTSEVIDMMLDSPKHMKVRYHKVAKRDTSLSFKLKTVLSNYDNTLVKSDPLSVSRSLLKIVLTLPKWVQITSRASQKTKAFRETVLKAHDPIELLYLGLPAVFNVKAPQEIASGVKDCIDELKQLNLDLMQEVRNCLFRAIDSDGATQMLNDRAIRIKDLTNQLLLKRFIALIAEYDGSDALCERILGLASGKMVGKWTDADITNAKLKISDLSFSFRHLEGIANLNEEGSTSRRLFGLVLAGNEGREDMIVDIPAELPAQAQSARDRIVEILNTLPREMAIAALIESGLKMDKEHG